MDAMEKLVKSLEVLRFTAPSDACYDALCVLGNPSLNVPLKASVNVKAILTESHGKPDGEHTATFTYICPDVRCQVKAYQDGSKRTFTYRFEPDSDFHRDVELRWSEVAKSEAFPMHVECSCGFKSLLIISTNTPTMYAIPWKENCGCTHFGIRVFDKTEKRRMLVKGKVREVFQGEVLPTFDDTGARETKLEAHGKAARAALAENLAKAFLHAMGE